MEFAAHSLSLAVYSPLYIATPPTPKSAIWLTKIQMNETYQHPGKWHDILLIPTLTRSSGNHYVMSHVIRGLEGNSVYEAIVQAKNRYGWNEVNDFCYNCDIRQPQLTGSFNFSNTDRPTARTICCVVRAVGRKVFSKLSVSTFYACVKCKSKNKIK